MMRRAVSIGLGGVAALLSALSVPAAAQTVPVAVTNTQRLELVGTAPAACTISAARVGSAVNATYASTGTSAGRIDITQFVDLETAQARPSSITLSLPVVCNGAHHVAVRSRNGGLSRGGGQINQRGSAPFAEFLNYDLGVEWAGQTLGRTSEQGGIDIASDQPGAGDFVIRIATADRGTPLVAGQYSDAIVIEFQPAN